MKPRRRGAIAFLAFMLLVLLAGGFLITMFRANPPPITRGASIGEHWHASYRIYVCGQRVSNYPNVEGEIHSHGDGFMHIHPSTQNFAGPNATLGSFLRVYETSIGELPNGKRTLIFSDGEQYQDGGRCPKSKKRYNIEVLNKGKKVKGDPAKITPHDGDEFVIKFGPRGEKPMPNPYNQSKGIPEQPVPQQPGPAPD